jgi:hypothetical protein
MRGERAQMERALAANRHEEYAKQATPVLWAWGSDFGGWPLSEKHRGNREKILSVLAEEKVPLPDGTQEENFELTWRRRTGEKGPMPTLAQEQEGVIDVSEEAEEVLTPEPDFESDEDEGEEDAGDDSPPPASLPLPRATQQGTIRACLACGNEQLTDSKAWTCEGDGCGFRGDLPSDHFINEDRRQARRGAIPAISPAATATKPAGETSQDSKLSTRDKEFLRLAEEGEPFGELDTSAPVAEGEAMERMRVSFSAHRYSRPSPPLLKLIRSGKLTHVGFATPVSFATERSKKEGEGTLLAENGTITVSEGEKASKKPVASLRDWMDALCSTILPALAHRPKAWLEWLALARSVIAVDRQYGFAVAEKYAAFTLDDKIGARIKFGEFDQRSLEAARAEATPYAQAGGQVARPQQQTAQQSSNLWDQEACRRWNMATCTDSSCKRKHVCSLIACPGDRADGHKASSHNKPQRGGGNRGSRGGKKKEASAATKA